MRKPLHCEGRRPPASPLHPTSRSSGRKFQRSREKPPTLFAPPPPPRWCAPKDCASERWAHRLVQVYSLARQEGVYSVSAYAAARSLQNLRKGGERTEFTAPYCHVLECAGFRLGPWKKRDWVFSGRQRSDKPEFAQYKGNLALLTLSLPLLRCGARPRPPALDCGGEH